MDPGYHLVGGLEGSSREGPGPTWWLCLSRQVFAVSDIPSHAIRANKHQLEKIIYKPQNDYVVSWKDFVE